jgi:voltage-gated sodium channel
MGEEKNALQAQAAHDEREHMSQQLAAVQRQLDQLTNLVKDKVERL